MPLLYVALGGAFGSMGRYLMAGAVGHAFGNGFPYGTLAVNVIGSFLMGLLTGALVDLLPGNNELRLLIGVGFLGGFTTFSAFSLDAALMLERGDLIPATMYILSNVLLSILALFAGLHLMRLLPW